MHRTINVFVCGRKHCQITGQGWQAFRGQCEDRQGSSGYSSKAARADDASPVAAEDWGIDAACDWEVEDPGMTTEITLDTLEALLAKRGEECAPAVVEEPRVLKQRKMYQSAQPISFVPHYINVVVVSSKLLRLQNDRRNI